MLFPAGLLLLVALGIKLLCWDTPKARLFKPSVLGKANPAGVMDYIRVCMDVRVIIVIFQYSACFGTELSPLPKHFEQYFQMSADDASLMASIFGLTNIFSRPLGGVFSDLVFIRFRFRARLWVQFFVLLAEGLLLIGFGSITSNEPVWQAAMVLFFFSVFCEMGCGTTYGIVPFINPEQLGVVSAMVGAGGNLGAVIASQAFYKSIASDTIPFQVHGGYVLFWAVLTPALYWPHLGGMFCGPGAHQLGEPAKEMCGAVEKERERA